MLLHTPFPQVLRWKKTRLQVFLPSAGLLEEQNAYFDASESIWGQHNLQLGSSPAGLPTQHFLLSFPFVEAPFEVKALQCSNHRKASNQIMKKAHKAHDDI